MKDEEGRIFNVEVQTTSRHNLPKRMRYYQSVLDISILAPGVDYETLNRSHVVFICNYDPFGRGRYIYTFENRCIEEPDLPLGDETTKTIINIAGTSGSISSELKEVLHYLNAGRATGSYTKRLDEAVHRVKVSEERRHEYMVMMIHDMEIREEGKAEGIKEGKAEGIIGAVEMLQEDGKSDAEIITRLTAKYTISDEEARKYIESAVVEN